MLGARSEAYGEWSNWSSCLMVLKSKYISNLTRSRIFNQLCHLETKFVVFPVNRLPFFKLIVPTVDSVRYEYLTSRLLAESHPVLLVGVVGTGKTSTAQSVLQKLDANKYSLLSINMSAQVRIQHQSCRS